MSVTEWAQRVGWTLVFFAIGIVVDMACKYRVQLIYAASHRGVRREARALTRPAIRHVFVFLITCAAEYLRFERVQDPLSAGVLILYALIIVYVLLLGRDSIREIKQGSD
ncbi:MAG TPA: hypothetical protein VGM84_10320 [Steroidobacteraceae bacterium]|jgi:hypothetical protein